MALAELPSRGARSDGRVPPHNLDAEESLLGAMLLSRDAIVAATEANLGAEEFYKPAHGHVFDAITTLYASGEPADPVTVAEELRRAGLLDAIGGPAVLVSLQASTPATSNAARYARIVGEHALLRKLISVAGEIAELGYSVPDDVINAVDRAESLVFDVAQRRVTDSMSPIKELLDASLTRLEMLYERGDAITGLATGYHGIDELMSGLQPSSLVIVGARPATGKALALDTPIPTPDGWATMGELEVGDLVIDEHGQPCKVLYTSPVFTDHKCFEVTFDDGTTIVADAGHRWLAYDYVAWQLRESSRSGRPRVVTTQDMFDEGVRAAGGSRPNWYLPLAAIDLPAAELPIDPYVLGCWLGRGSIADELQAVGLLRGERQRLVPKGYLRSSWKQRLALLQGLMDTEGSVASSGSVELCLADRELLDQVWELVVSLGHKPDPIVAKRVPLDGASSAPVWAFRWTPLDPVFRFEPKAAALDDGLNSHWNGLATRRAIVDIVEVPTVPTRCIAVDSPSHLFLASKAMIPTHNTAFALGMATHAALEARRPVLFFSLEMSHLELTQRILSAEARVESTRMRNGKLAESDWTKLSHAIGRLAEAPLYIDDNPHATVLEIRAKARRLKSRIGDLGLIVIDYLQLMTGRTRAENRQVEVSEISRGLKILARELEVPVVALSQLSRNLEARADKRPMLADLRESGCMPASTRLLRADTGAEVTLGELVLSQEQPLVWSLDEQWRLVPRRLVKAFPSGIKPVFRLRLASGYEVEATANHPFRTLEGWTRLDELAVGTAIATPRRIHVPVQPAQPWDENELILLAHLLGDGSMGPNSVKYATSDPENRAVVAATAERLFGIEVKAERRGSTWQMWLPSPYRLTHGRQHPVRNWLEPLGLWGSRSHNKFVPEPIFGLADGQIALFLRHLWATDGSITIGRNRRGRVVNVYYATTSRRLADGVRRLLLRLDIPTRLRQARKNGYRDSWHVAVNGSENLARFLTLVGCHGGRGDCISEALSIVSALKPNPNVDLVPWSVANQVKASLAQASITQRALASALGEQYCGSYLLGSADRPRRFSRPRLEQIGRVVGDEQLMMLATSDVFWDEIVEITSVGEMPTFDATVEGTHNFIADGVIVHNSLEQDADVVMFLYRDELYNQESPDRGTAEVLVAKHRSGPTGMDRLAFLDHYTRFANMARNI